MAAPASTSAPLTITPCRIQIQNIVSTKIRFEKELEVSKDYLKELRGKSGEEKKKLEEQCNAFEKEIQKMKKHVEELDEKREEYEKEIPKITLEHKERVRVFHQSLDGKTA